MEETKEKVVDINHISLSGVVVTEPQPIKLGAHGMIRCKLGVHVSKTETDFWNLEFWYEEDNEEFILEVSKLKKRQRLLIEGKVLLKLVQISDSYQYFPSIQVKTFKCLSE